MVTLLALRYLAHALPFMLAARVMCNVRACVRGSHVLLTRIFFSIFVSGSDFLLSMQLPDALQIADCLVARATVQHPIGLLFRKCLCVAMQIHD
jgi:hypothetical protein